MDEAIAIAPALALAEVLDREDFDAARALMRDDCIYEFRGELIHGADAIVASYRGNGDKARKHFDRIEYQSSVVPVDEGQARIDYTDIVNHAGDTLIHRCAQEVDFDSGGAITRIRHVDFPGEREAVAAFFNRHLPDGE